MIKFYYNTAAANLLDIPQLFPADLIVFMKGYKVMKDHSGISCQQWPQRYDYSQEVSILP